MLDLYMLSKSFSIGPYILIECSFPQLVNYEGIKNK